MKHALRVSAAMAAAALSLPFLALPCLAQSAPSATDWNGSWKTDPASMHFDGTVYDITTDASGFAIASGGKEFTKMECMGKPVTNPSGSVNTCVKAGTGYSVTTTRDGKTVSVISMSVASGGKKMMRVAKYTPPTEAPYSITLTYDRMGGGSGMAGSWKETGFSESQDTGVLSIVVTGDSVAFKETDSPNAMVCKLDGTPTVTSGKNTMSVTAIDPHTLKVKYMSADGKIVRENTFALSLDGKVISETDFTADPTPSAETQLFHKM
jgi:hypothetical protein